MPFWLVFERADGFEVAVAKPEDFFADRVRGECVVGEDGIGGFGKTAGQRGEDVNAVTVRDREKEVRPKGVPELIDEIRSEDGWGDDGEVGIDDGELEDAFVVADEGGLERGEVGGGGAAGQGFDGVEIELLIFERFALQISDGVAADQGRGDDGAVASRNGNLDLGLHEGGLDHEMPRGGRCGSGILRGGGPGEDESRQQERAQNPRGGLVFPGGDGRSGL